MTTPKKPLSKTESAIQLGNVLKYAAGGRGGKLRKIGEKATKSASPIKEVKKAKKSLKNQKVIRKAVPPNWKGLSTGYKKYLKEIMKTPSFKKAQKEMEKPVPSGYGSKKNPNKKERELEKRFQKHKQGKK